MKLRCNKVILALCVLSAILVLAAAGCGGSATTTGASTTGGEESTTTSGGSAGTGAQSSGTVTLGFVVGLTGKYAAPESPLVNGVKMAVEEINAAGGIDGTTINLVIEDTGSEQTGAINAYNRVVSANPIAIMDTTLSAFVLAQLDLIKENAIPTLTGASSANLTNDNSGWLFRIRTTDAVMAKAAAQYAIEGFGEGKKIGLIYANDEYGKGWKAVTDAAMQEAGVTLVAEEAAGVDDKDLSAQLLKMQQAGAEVVISGNQPTVQAILMKQAKQLGMPYQLLVSPAGVLPTTLELMTPDETEGVYGLQSAIPTLADHSKDWAAEYEAKFGLAADSSAGEYYDGVMMIADAIKAGADTPQAVADYLWKVKDRQGMGNTWTFAPNGDGGRQAMILRIENNELVPVETLVVDVE